MVSEDIAISQGFRSVEGNTGMSTGLESRLCTGSGNNKITRCKTDTINEKQG